VGVSDGVRAIRDSVWWFQQEIGPWFELDRLTAPYKAMDPLDPAGTKNFVSVTAYSADYSPLAQMTLQTGPSGYTGPSDHYSIILGPSGLDPAPFHVLTIHLALIDTNGALVRWASDDLVGMRSVLLLQQVDRWVQPPLKDGVPAVTSPPQGPGAGAPAEGGGIGIESSPAWLGHKGVPHAPRPV